MIIAATGVMIFKMNRQADNEHAAAGDGSHASTARQRQLEDDRKSVSSFVRNAHRENPTFDKDDFIAAVQSLSAAPQSANADQKRQVMMFMLNNSSKIASATIAQLKETCIELEQAEPSIINEHVRDALVMAIIKSEPEWGITYLDKMFRDDPGQASITSLITAFGKQGYVGSANWGPAYAAALDKWLSQAVADGRVDGNQVEVATMRFDLALASGDPDGALAHLKHIPADQLGKSLDGLASEVRGSDQCRQTMEKIAPLIDTETLRKFSTSLAINTGYDEARKALESAKLTPEGHDFAAAGIAVAEIGPLTASRAEWLVRSLQSEGVAAVTRFTASWTQASHRDAVAWIESLPAGKVRDAATAGYAPLVAIMDGESAAQWALFISEPALRDSTFESVIQTWRNSEPEAAAAYLQRMQNK